MKRSTLAVVTHLRTRPRWTSFFIFSFRWSTLVFTNEKRQKAVTTRDKRKEPAVVCLLVSPSGPECWWGPQRCRLRRRPRRYQCRSPGIHRTRPSSPPQTLASWSQRQTAWSCRNPEEESNNGRVNVVVARVLFMSCIQVLLNIEEQGWTECWPNFLPLHLKMKS